MTLADKFVSPLNQPIKSLLLWQLNISNVMPDLIRHPDQSWIPAFVGMTALIYCCRSNNS